MVFKPGVRKDVLRIHEIFYLNDNCNTVPLIKMFLVLFCACRTAYIFRDNAKKFTSVDLSYKYVKLF